MSFENACKPEETTEIDCIHYAAANGSGGGAPALASAGAASRARRPGGTLWPSGSIFRAEDPGGQPRSGARGTGQTPRATPAIAAWTRPRTASFR